MAVPESGPAQNLDGGELPEELAGLGAVASTPSDSPLTAEQSEMPDELAGLGAVTTSEDGGQSDEAGSLLDDADLDAESIGLGDLDIQIGGEQNAPEGLDADGTESSAGGLDDEDEEDAQYRSLLGEDLSVVKATKEPGPNEENG
jgi:hypothetical protein